MNRARPTRAQIKSMHELFQRSPDGSRTIALSARGFGFSPLTTSSAAPGTGCSSALRRTVIGIPEAVSSPLFNYWAEPTEMHPHIARTSADH